MVTKSYGDVGMAGISKDTFSDIALFSGDAPVITTVEELADQNADLPAYSVVGRITSGGKITLCNPGASDGSQFPIGITCVKVLDNSADNLVPIYRGGMFNPAALNWHAGFNTDALKKLAFEAKQPTIFIRAPKTQSA